MRDGRSFTEQEDRLIKYLYDQQNIKNWGLVSATLTQQLQFRRNAKQCRDRYRQYLDSDMPSQWTREEQAQLYQLHNTVGNKWVIIANYFPGKTDNCVKNHFYSKLRKAMRHLNKIIKKKFRKQYKQLKIMHIYKIIQGFQQQFKQKPCASIQISNYCAKLKNTLLEYAEQNYQDNMIGQYFQEKQLIYQIFELNRNYRKKSKKQKRQSLQLSQLFKPSIIRSDQSEYTVKIQNDDQQSEFQQIRSQQQQSGKDMETEKEIKIGNKLEITRNNSNNFNTNYNSNYDKNQSNNRFEDNAMEKQQPELRKFKNVVLVEDQQLRISNKSKQSIVMIREDNLRNSWRMSEQSDHAFNNRRWSDSQGQNDILFPIQQQNLLKHPFGFMKGQSSFRSYRSESNRSDFQQMDMFGDDIRISGKLKQSMKMEEQRDQLFRSQK